MRAQATTAFIGLGLLSVGIAGACGGGGTNDGSTCSPACTEGQACVAGACVPSGTGGAGQGGAGQGGDVFQDAGCPAAQECGAVCCNPSEFCALGQTCAHSQPACAANDDCLFDSYCEAGQCIPYGFPSDHDHDATCINDVDIGAIVPSEQCRWTGPPAGDAHPNHFHVMATPVVVDFNFDNDPKTLSPSVVFTSFPTSGSYQNPGILRVISGGDCSQQWSFSEAGDTTMSPASVAAGDLDGDGHPEIVAVHSSGGLIAFRFDPAAKTFTRYWRSGTCVNNMGPPTVSDTTGGTDKWSGPSIHDLDNDGQPEIIYGATVYRADGCRVDGSLPFPVYSKGVIPVIADVDEDGKMELVRGDAIHEWDAAAAAWVAEPYFTGAPAAGQVAVAELGSFPLASFGGQDRAEIVVVSTGKIRVQTLEGTIVFGPITIPGGGTGGAPTIADFDGDGRREFASAGGNQYVVFDFDCLAGGDPAKCGGQAPGTGILWTQPSQDASSNVTGSSVFDFDYDGKAEAVYADECFLRVYDGTTGAVIYSVARSSGTTYENPVIADVDGDYHTEIVSAVNNYAGGLGCPANDPLFPAAAFSQNHGIVVLRDAEDRWAASRPVWSQHAYAVTHVGDHGEIPKTSSVAINWKDAKLNNFRQNVQGDLEVLGQPDLTAGGDVGAVKCQGSIATIEARVCNRGTLPMVSGTEVTFYDGSVQGPELCTAQIPVALAVAECTIVNCQADIGEKTLDIYVLVDPKSQTLECHEKNNAALYQGVACGAIPQ
ncbi:MAG TPA: VCBS repeat-containing protein [Polyangiaceae bacterium]|nr:VCBS repeat-containing protein [Polyangiaceae bacterium]